MSLRFEYGMASRKASQLKRGPDVLQSKIAPRSATPFSVRTPKGEAVPPNTFPELPRDTAR